MSNRANHGSGWFFSLCAYPDLVSGCHAPLPLKLTPGSDLRLSLEELARTQQLSGFVLGVVGNLSRAPFSAQASHSPRCWKAIWR